jgi:riboflavin synthase
MFTGIVAAVGRIAHTAPAAGGVRLRVDAGGLPLDDVAVGDSIAVNGVCLTVVARDTAAFEADVSRETLDCTAGFPTGGRVNLEKALRLSDRLGGHFVSGHVDGIGKVRRFEGGGDHRWLAVAAPRGLAKYIARKGAIALNGVSLTINAVNDTEFDVSLIPHTLQTTGLMDLRTGDPVNLEVDLLARYLERFLEAAR